MLDYNDLPPSGSTLNHNHSMRLSANRAVYATLPILRMFTKVLCQSHSQCHESFLFVWKVRSGEYTV